MADEIMATEEQELFQLSNGRYIMDKDLSQKMFYIKEAKPERSHQISGTGYSWDESAWRNCFLSATRMILGFARKPSVGTPIQGCVA